MKASFEKDIKKILDHRYDNGGDFWATPDGRIYKGNPFSTIGSLAILYELLRVEPLIHAFSSAQGLASAPLFQENYRRSWPLDRSPFVEKCWSSEASSLMFSRW